MLPILRNVLHSSLPLCHGNSLSYCARPFVSSVHVAKSDHLASSFRPLQDMQPIAYRRSQRPKIQRLSISFLSKSISDPCSHGRAQWIYIVDVSNRASSKLFAVHAAGPNARLSTLTLRKQPWSSSVFGKTPRLSCTETAPVGVLVGHGLCFQWYGCRTTCL